MNKWTILSNLAVMLGYDPLIFKWNEQKITWNANEKEIVINSNWMIYILYFFILEKSRIAVNIEKLIELSR